jgi:dihydroorotate dehydrogenase (fumarate)
VNTTTSYLGFRLPHPFIAGASPFGYQVDTVRRLEDAGCAAVVLHSLFEEQITEAIDGRIHHMDTGDPRYSEALVDFPESGDYAHGPDDYAEHVTRVKGSVGIPVIASLNGTSPEAWLRFASVIEQAGADALELNLYQVVTELGMSGAAVEHELVEIVRQVRRTIRIPVAVKLGPFFTAFGNVARRMDEAGADALVLFNRFYQPDIDIRTMSPHTQLELSTSAELLLRLRWLAMLHGNVRCSLAASGGVVTPHDGIKALLAGAHVVQLVSALLRHGPAYLGVMREKLERWMEWNRFEGLGEMRGRASLAATGDAAAFERAHYIRTLQSWLRPPADRRDG